MKSEYVYERRQLADRMEVIMVIASAIGTIAAIFVFFSHGWLPSLALFLLSVIAFALSRVFDLLADVLTSVGRFEEGKKLSRSDKGDNTDP